MANITVEEIRRLLITKSITHYNNMDLSGLDLSGLDFSSLTLASSNFSDTRLIKAKFVTTFLSKYNFQGANLT